MGAVQVTVVQIVCMVAMLDGCMTAAFAVDVGMQFLKFMMLAHENAFSSTIRVTLTKWLTKKRSIEFKVWTAPKKCRNCGGPWAE